jgi:hypothetical protein
MAKIVHKGMWIDIKSLNPVDKKNFLTSLVFGFIASIFMGDALVTHWFSWKRANHGLMDFRNWTSFY